MIPIEPNSPIDPNKIIASFVIEAAKEPIASIMEKVRASGEDANMMQADARLEIRRLKTWKKYEKSVLVILKAYLGLVDLLQEDDLRDQLLLHDTGGGLLFARPEIRDYLTSARISRVSDISKEVQAAVRVVEKNFLPGAYVTSVESLFNTVRPNLDLDFGELIELRFQYLQWWKEKARINEFLNLQIPILEYQFRLQEIFRSISIVCKDAVNLLVRLVGKLDSDHFKEHADKIQQTTRVALTSLVTLRGFCDKYNDTESYRLDCASSKQKFPPKKRGGRNG